MVSFEGTCINARSPLGDCLSVAGEQVMRRFEAASWADAAAASRAAEAHRQDMVIAVDAFAVGSLFTSWLVDAAGSSLCWLAPLLRSRLSSTTAVWSFSGISGWAASVGFRSPTSLVSMLG